MTYEQYLSAGMHIGMKQQTKNMKKFVYKIRNDGLAVLDLQMIEKRIKIAAGFLSRFNKILAVSRKAVGWKAAHMFAETTGGSYVSGRFLPGTITNPHFPSYYEPDVLIVTDPIVDSQAVKEAVKMRIPIVALCDTTNKLNNVDCVIPVNNKGRKSVATVYWLLAREIMKIRKQIKEDEEFGLEIEDFEIAERPRR